MVCSNTQLEKRVYAPEPCVLSTPNTALHEQLIGSLREALSKQIQQDLPAELRVMHKEACKCICAVSMTVRCENSTVLVPTQINVYFVWIAWMRAMCCTSLHATHPKLVYVEYFKGMTLQKLAVLVPTVCFWLCQKCMETWNVTCSQLERVIAAVQRAKNICSFQCTMQDVVDTEHAILQLLDFDILKHQENVDAIEDILREHFEDFKRIHECVNAQTEVARSLYHTFHDVM
jgi:hypothetical protein